MIFAFVLLAHSWYQSECCGEGDCRPVPCGEIVNDANARWLWRGMQSVRSPLESQDGQCHVCPHFDSDHNRTYLFCIYLPKETS